VDYYASWPSWKMPKWMGAALGGIFTTIVVACAFMIVSLTRPAHPRATAMVAPAAAPKVETPAPVAPATATPAAATAPEAEPTPLAAAIASATAPKSATATKSSKPAAKKPAHKRAILAKHDARSGRGGKSELDRLLGL
jgi:hypothetical protein